MEIVNGIHAVFGDRAATNVLLAACVLRLHQLYPYVRALAAHFKLQVPAPEPARARTEPGE